MPILSLITFIPLLGSIVILCMPKSNERLIRLLAAVFSGIPLMLGVLLYFGFDKSAAGMQFTEKFDWVIRPHITYFLGVDGLSIAMILLTVLLSFLSVIFSFNIKEKVKEYFFFFLMLETGMLGVFAALDFFLFYIFWELTLVPMYFLIGIWGGPRKEYAAIKFFLYTLFGSVIMLLGILALYFTSTPNTFDILELSKNQPFTPLFQILVYLSLFIGFAVKVPIFPFHTWLPDAHVEAPTAVSVILAGVLLKMGTYGILRVSYTVLPLAAKQFIPILAFLALINIVYGAFVAMAQKDLKKMIAYSSINHMGYVLLGMIAILGDKAAEGLNGAVFQMFNHGIITGMLFLLVGVLYDRAHTRDIDSFGGLKNKMPVYSGLMITACMASLGLPGLAGFISEFMCFIGGFAANKLVTIISALGIVVTAAYFLIMIQKVFLGGPNEKWKDLKDIDARELIAVVPLMALTVLLGIFPQFAIDLSDATIRVLVDTLAKVKL